MSAKNKAILIAFFSTTAAGVAALWFWNDGQHKLRKALGIKPKLTAVK